MSDSCTTTREHMIYTMECLRQDVYVSLHLLCSSSTYCSLRLMKCVSVVFSLHVSAACLQSI